MRELIDKFINYLKLQRNYSKYTCLNYYEDLNEYEDFLKSYNSIMLI